MINFIISQFPALIVILPIISSGIILIFSKKIKSNLVFLISNIISFLLVLVVYSSANGELKYSFGNWNEEIAINFKLDLFSIYILFLFYFILLLFSVFMYSCFRNSIENLLLEARSYLPYMLMLFIVASYVGLVLTNDIFNLYVFLEIASLASYPLFAISPNKNSYKYAFEYLIIGTIGATIILIAVGLILATKGTLNLELVKNGFSETSSAPAILFLVGVLIKLGVFPMHLWKTKSYTYSSNIISCFFISISSLVFVAILYKFRFISMNIEANQYIMLKFLAYLTLISGAFLALISSNYRELILFSSVSSVGYYILLWPFETKESIDILLQFLFAESLIKLGLMFVPNLVGKEDLSIRDLINLAQKNRYVGIMLLILLFNLASLPPSLLFFNKIYFISQSLKNDQILDVIAIIMSSAIGILYSFRIARQIYKNSEFEYNIRIKNNLVYGVLVINTMLILSIFFNSYFSNLSLRIFSGG